MVAFLLIFGCADILSPQLCDEDLEVATHFASPSPVRSAGADFSQPSIDEADSTGTHQEQSSHPAPADDD